jgi:hypothetical protein
MELIGPSAGKAALCFSDASGGNGVEPFALIPRFCAFVRSIDNRAIRPRSYLKALSFARKLK